MNINELTFAIIEWEKEAQECFMDYYLHDNVLWTEWAAWLFNSGHKERALNIRYQIDIAKNRCIDQELLFRVFGSTAVDKEDYAEENVTWQEDEDKWMELYRKDVFLWAQYLCADEERLHHITRWLHNYPETWLD